MAYYKQFSSYLENYELANAKDPIKGDMYKKVKLINNEDRQGLKQSLEKMINERNNPYV